MLKSRFRMLVLVLAGALVLAFAVTASAEGPNHFRADLQPNDSTGVTGRAELQLDSDGQLHVVVHVKGFEPGEHINHIHVNSSCDDPGGVLQGLTPLTANGAGIATAKSTLDASGVPDPANQVIAVHALDFSIVACGEINPVP